MAISREESQQQTRERLVTSAERAVARHGYAGCSIGAIVEAAGFTKGAFFSNFENKDALLLEVLRRHYLAELARLESILDDTRAQVELDAALDGYIDHIVNNPDWMMLGVELALRASRDPAFAVGYRQMRADFTLALGRLTARLFARKGRAAPLAPQELGNLMLSLVQGIGLSAAAGTSQPPPSQFTRLVLHGLITAAAPAEPGPD